MTCNKQKQEHRPGNTNDLPTNNKHVGSKIFNYYFKSVPRGGKVKMIIGVDTNSRFLEQSI
jgi:hypothetical protein